jgi:crotonobetainyl-CoA:carnitine CoA-transferase CaiB-like acyl-CoA transferase
MPALANDRGVAESHKLLPLDGVRVVECGDGVATAFATKLMALLGAEVIKVEPPGGDSSRFRGPFFDDRVDPEASGLFLYLNADKSGVTLDLRALSDRAKLDELLAGADILVHNIPPGERASLQMESAALHAAHPDLIVTGISAYGDWGPRARWRAYELNTIHAGGVAALSPLCSKRPDLPPLKLYGQQAEFQAANHAAFTTLAAWFHRIRRNEVEPVSRGPELAEGKRVREVRTASSASDSMTAGSGQVIEVSAQECLVAMLELSFLFYSYMGLRTSRLGGRLLGPWRIFDCRNGKLLLACVEEHQWQSLVRLMGEPEWAREEIFKDRLTRGRNSDALTLMMEDWVRQWDVTELFHACQERRIPAAPVNRMADIFTDRHLQERNFFVPLPLRDGGHHLGVPSMPFNASDMGWRLERSAPRLGEHNGQIPTGRAPKHIHNLGLATPPPSPSPVSNNGGGDGSGPLSGIRVLDFSWIWQGPFCTLQLAHLGAEVIRVESAKKPEINRLIPPFADGKAGINRAGSFNQWNQGKRSIMLDLGNPAAIEIARSLVPYCDLVVENFAPGVIGRMGLGYETLSQLKPDIIMLSLSGYGQTGPYSRYVSYGGLLGAQSGLFSVSGYTSGEPGETGITYGDPNSGALAVFAAIAALIHRARTGRGQYIDISLWEALEMVMPEGWLEYVMNGREPAVTANRDRLMTPHNCYKSKGDVEEWITIAVGTETEWSALCSAIGQPTLVSDARFANAALRKQNEDELDAIITRWASERDRWDAAELLQQAGVAAMPTLTNKDLALDSHLRERGFLVELEHPEVGRRTHAGVPWTMSATPCRVRCPAPILGADTDEVLMSLLGYSAEKIESLHRDGVIA